VPFLGGENISLIGVDIHKKYCLGIIEGNNTETKLRFPNTRNGWKAFLKNEEHIDKVIIEAGSVSEKTLRYLEDLNVPVKMANPRKARLIAEATIKTDELDAKRLIDLEKVGLLPESWIPSREIRDIRHLCRYRYFLVQIRTKIKNRIHYELDREDINVKTLTYKYLETVKEKTIMIDQLYRLLKEINEKIREVEKEIEREYSNNEYSRIIDTIPGISKYGSLLLSMEIGDINRFSNSKKLASYAGLVPREYQSGTREWKGHITKEGNKWIRWILDECLAIHINVCPESPISIYYRSLVPIKGNGKAKIAAERRLLSVIYVMLKEKITFDQYIKMMNRAI